MRVNFFRGISAGLCIALGGSVYLACENKVVGAVLFSVALISICMLSLSLYTGKIGFIVQSHKKDDFIALAATLLGNLAGCIIFGLLVSVGLSSLHVSALAVVDKKLAQSFIEALIRGYFCGVLMYIAVWCYREKKTPLAIVFCIPAFILSGFEHSVANMFYFALAQKFTLQALGYIGIIVIGNTLGSITVPLVEICAGIKSEKQ